MILHKSTLKRTRVFLGFTVFWNPPGTKFRTQEVPVWLRYFEENALVPVTLFFERRSCLSLLNILSLSFFKLAGEIRLCPLHTIKWLLTEIHFWRCAKLPLCTRHCLLYCTMQCLLYWQFRLVRGSPRCCP